MSTPSIINITLETLCIVICLILLICLRIGDRAKSKLNILFFRLLITDIALLASSIVTWFFDGSGKPYAYTVLVVSNFLLYFLWYILKSNSSNYMFSYISARTEISRRYLYAFWSICAVSVIWLFISQFTGLCYSIDSSNRFQRSGLYWIAYIGPIALYILGLVMVFIHRNGLNKKDTIVLLTFEILPVAALFLQIPHFGIMLLNTTSTISLLILYVRIQMEDNKRLELELADSRVSIMLSQIHPHFLYNSLVVIGQLCEIDPEAAAETVVEFSGYLRGNLDSLTIKTLIPFNKELKHVECYLSIEKKRFEDRLNIAYDIKTRDFMLPALTLQPIVENAVRYGVTKRPNGGTVTIRTEETEGECLITVIDNGVGFDPMQIKADERTHTGIENVRNRLAVMCGGSLDIKSAPGAGTTAVIIIPNKEVSQ